MDASGIRLTCALVLFAGWTGAQAASPRDYEGLRVQSIEFVPPSQPLPDSEIHNLLPMRVGDTLQLAAVRQAIERLYATLEFTDIAVDARRVEGGVALRFLTEQAWFVSRVSVEGVPEPPAPAQLATATKIELGSLYSDDLMESGVRNLLETLRENGYYEATTRPQLQKVEATSEANISLPVDPGPHARFARPVFVGAPPGLDKKLESSTRWARFWLLPGWKPVTEARLQQGLERVRKQFRERDLLMARVQLEAMRYDPATASVTPTVRVDPGPKIKVVVEGAKVSQGRLRQLIPVFQEQSVDGSLLAEGRRNLAEYFQARGYFDAKVNYSLSQDNAGAQLIRYTVDRGARHKITAVRVEGNQYFDQATIRERLNTMAATRLRYRHGRFSREFLERDRDSISDLYRTNGFPDVRVTTSVLEGPPKHPDEQTVVFRIQEGPQWLVRSMELSGVDLRLYEQVLALLQSTQGQPYSAANVAADRDNLLSYYHNNGYPETALEVTSLPDPKTHRVQLRYVVREGRRLFVRDVLIGGLRSTNRDLVTERISLEPGDPFSQGAIIESQRRLNDLGIFAKVDIALQNPDGKTRSKYLLYQFEEARKYSFNGGFGAEIGRIGGSVTSFESPGGGTGFSPRVSLGVSRSNFFGVGHTAGVQTTLSNIQKRALLTYLAPQFKNNERLSLTFTALYDDSRNVRTFSARRLEGATQFAQRLSRATTVQYRIAFRRVSVDQNTLKIAPQLIDLLSQPVRVGQISAALIQDHRDEPVDPHRGMYSSADFGLATKALASQSSFVRLLGRNSSYHPVSRDWVLARSTTIGFMGNQGVKDIPLPERFFGGGATSHRGFPESQAGPRDLVTGFPLGGQAIFVNQTELRFPLIGETIGGVLFHDAGNVYQDVRHFSLRVLQHDSKDFNYMVHAVGMGVRYRTPIGPVRLDLAYSINSPRFIGFQGTRQELLEGRGRRDVPQRINHFQFHFSLGQSF